MARLPSFKRLYKQDFSADQQDLIEKLASSLNYGIEALYQALDGELTLADNFAVTIRQVTVNVNAQGIPKSTTGFTVDTTGPISGVIVINAANLTNPTTYPSGGIFISYTQTDNRIIINHVAGLPADNNFNISLLALK